MLNKTKYAKTGLSVSILIGTVIGLLTMILFVFLTTASILNNTLNVEMISYITPFILLTASFVSSYISGRLVNGDKLLACGGVVAAILFTLIAICILAFGGQFQSVPVGVLSVLVGGGGAYLLNLRKPKPKYRKRRL